MKKITYILTCFCWCLLACNQNPAEDKEKTVFPILKGEYMGQAFPDSIAELFAPGIISTGLYVRDIAMTPDRKEIYFCISSAGYNLIFFTKEVDGVWTEPALPTFVKNPKYMYYEPCIASDGKKMFFLSNMPKDSSSEENEDIWVVDRRNDGWGEPYNLGEPVCTDSPEFFPSITSNGTLYFTRQTKGSQENNIYRSKLVNGRYQEPEKLPEQVNCGTNRFNAYVSKDESFMIVPAAGMENTLGGVDYYIVFRNEDDTWQEPINMGSQINSENGRQWSAYISPDDKYLFFMSSRSTIRKKDDVLPTYKMLLDQHSGPGNGNADIYWISTKVIDQLKHTVN